MKPPAIKWHKGIQCLDDRFSVAQAWKRWWHGKIWRLSLTFILQTMLHQGVEPGVVKKRKEWDFSCRGRGTQALLLGPGNVVCTGWLRVGTRIFWLLVLQSQQSSGSSKLVSSLGIPFKWLSLTTSSGLFPYAPWRCALQHPQASFPMHHGGIPYNSLRPPYTSWRCALQQPQASLCNMEVCLTTASGLPMHHVVTSTECCHPPTF